MTLQERSRWIAAPMQLMRYLDCAHKHEEVLRILQYATSIARRHARYQDKTVSEYIQMMLLTVCTRYKCITSTDYNHLVNETNSPDARALMAMYWLHCLQFIHKHAKHEGDLANALGYIAPDMGSLTDLLVDLMAEERDRRYDRMRLKKGEITAGPEETIRLSARTAKPLLDTVATMLKGFRYLDLTLEYGMQSWRQLLLKLATGEYIDLNVQSWQQIAYDIVIFHCTKDDFPLEAVLEELTAAMGCPHIRQPGQMHQTLPIPTPAMNPFISRSDYLGLLYGLLKTGKYRTSKIFGIKVLFEREVSPLMNSRAPYVLRTMALECVDILGNFDHVIAETYVGRLLDVALDLNEDVRLRESALNCTVDFGIAHDFTRLDKWLIAAKHSVKEVFGLIQNMVLDKDGGVVCNATVAAFKILVNTTVRNDDIKRTISIIFFRLLHPDSVHREVFRACVTRFATLFGSLGRAQQKFCTDVCLDMLSILRDRLFLDYIDEENPTRAILFMVASCAPDRLFKSVKATIPKSAPTAHMGLLLRLLHIIDACSDNRRMLEMLVEVASVVHLEGMNKIQLEDLYNRAYSMVDMVKDTCKARSRGLRDMRIIVKNIETAMKYLEKVALKATEEGRTLTVDDNVVPTWLTVVGKRRRAPVRRPRKVTGRKPAKAKTPAKKPRKPRQKSTVPRIPGVMRPRVIKKKAKPKLIIPKKLDPKQLLKRKPEPAISVRPSEKQAQEAKARLLVSPRAHLKRSAARRNISFLLEDI